MKDKKTVYEVEALYLGERIGFVGGISYLFRKEDGQTVSFKGSIKGIYFGESYLVSKAGEIKIRFPQKPEKQKIFPTDQEKLDYEAQKEIVKDYRLRRKKEMQIKKPHKDIVSALSLLRPFVRSMDRITLGRFVGYIENQLSKRGKK